MGKRASGGEEEDRTPDLRIANATLSQLSYPPTVFLFYTEWGWSCCWGCLIRVGVEGLQLLEGSFYMTLLCIFPVLNSHEYRQIGV